MNFILKVPKLCELKSSSYIHLVQRNENVGFKFWEISTKEIQKFADKFPNFSEQEVGVKNAAPWYLIYISTIYYSRHIIQKLLFCFFTCVQSIVSLIIEGGVCYVLLFNVFPANIWLLFCIQSVWSDIVFWKQIKLIPKMHISNRYLEQKCCINNSWILSVFCANKLYQLLLFFISELNQTISYNFFSCHGEGKFKVLTCQGNLLK